jgi:hypothetical protein
MSLNAREVAGVEVDGPPAVPGDDRAIGTVRVTERLKLARTRHRDLPGEAVAAPNTKVARGPDIEAAELEDEKHLRRPPTDAAHGGEAVDDFLIALTGESTRSEDDGLVEDLAGQIPQRRDLRGGQAGASQRLDRKRQHGFGPHFTVERGDDAAMDRRRGRSRQLLVDDRLDQVA